MRITPLSIALALAITASSTAQAQQFTQVVSFGDSLTDAGNTAAVDGNPYTLPGNSWTTNPDSVHSQYLSQLLGLGLQNYSLAGGSDYAFAGACAMKNGTVTAAGVFNCYLPFPSVTDQVTGYITAHAGQVDSTKIYTLWAGANDILTGAGISVGAAQAYAGQSAATTVGLAGALLNAGAKTVVVFNLPDLGKTPNSIASGSTAAAGATGLSAIYNAAFDSYLGQLPDGIVAINTFGLINEIIASPATYGFTNVTQQACLTGPGIGGSATSGACGPVGSGEPWTYATGTNNTYLFADGIHPTGAAHQMLANVVYATISAPGIVSLAPQVALQSQFAQNTAINEALDVELASTDDAGKVRGFTTVQYGQQNIESSIYTPSLDGDSYGLNVGATYRMNENGSFGVIATLGNTSANAENLATYSGDSILFGIFGQFEFEHLYGRASFGGGNTDMEIRRNIFLGPSVRRETGNTGISQLSGSAELGYLFKGENYTHGPFISAETNSADVESYVEDGSSSSAMRFDKFSAENNMSHLGYQFTGKFGSFSPYVRISYASSFGNDQTFVRGGTASMPGNFSLPGYLLTDEDFIDWNVGASMNFAENFDGYISYRGLSGNDRQDSGVINLGIRKTF
ncbi:MAG: autotransporter domain-containing protein [Arenimonas sp.]|nr:autotransporter domain-containing protein [Arenimonas sp.]